MRFPMIAALLLVSGLLLGCRARENPKSDSPQTSPPTKTADANPKTTAPISGVGEIDIAKLPKEGPGDPTLTYDVVKADPAKYRGKRVTWAIVALSGENKRMMCGLDKNEAIGPRHAGIYVIEFATDNEVGDLFRRAAFPQPGSTVTATVAGQVDQFLVVWDGKGNPQKDIPKVTVPLLVYPTYNAGEAGGIKGKAN